MPKLIITIFEPSAARVVEALRALPQHCDGAEVRVDAIAGSVGDRELREFRAATSKPLIYTRRTRGPGTPLTREEIAKPLVAGFDYIDVEIGEPMPRIDDIVARVILSHHNYMDAARPSGDRAGMRLKIAVTPKTFEENLSILRTLANGTRNLTYFGMGSRGLYSRMLAPFFGSEFAFVARDRASIAAPGQMTFEDAIALYGEMSRLQLPDAIFAVVGDPASHSRSPEIHNAIFHGRNINAVYAIAEVEKFEEVGEAMVRADELAPRGVSITAPFKEVAFAFAKGQGAEISDRARRCGAINTLVRIGSYLHADNTDIDAFERVVDRIKPRSAAVIGAGGTARAALVALTSRGVAATVYNRTLVKASALAIDFGAEARPLDDLATSYADLVVNTVSSGSGFTAPAQLFRRGLTYVDVAYDANHRASIDAALSAGVAVVDGLELLRIQAEAQSKMFVDSVRDLETRMKDEELRMKN